MDRSLAVLLHLHRHIRPDHCTNPQCKKVGDMTQFVLYRIVEEMEDEVSKVIWGERKRVDIGGEMGDGLDVCGGEEVVKMWE